MADGKMQNILEQALLAVKPTLSFEKEIKGKIQQAIDRLNQGLSGAKAVLGGSGVKDTWLKDAYDADIFVTFDYKRFKDKSGLLSDILERTVKKRFSSYSRIHGSRDYFQVKLDGITVEIIPTLAIKNAKEAMNITDVSLLHSAWVNSKGKGLKDQIRLTKQFCKAANVYGAESYIRGFSGYVCEILTIHFKGFLNLVKEASGWKGEIVIDPARHWKGKDALMQLNTSKINSPLIVVDPVQKDRNASAALNAENVGKFMQACKSFLKSPSINFFNVPEISEGSLLAKAGKNHLFLLEPFPYEGKMDVVGCQVAKAIEFMKIKFNSNEFPVIQSGFQMKPRCMAYFIIERKKLSPVVIREGPPVSAKPHVEGFKKKHKKTFVKGQKIFAEEPRTFKGPGELLPAFKESDYLKSKIKGFRILCKS